ncbi:MAG: TonB-dependent receptor [Thermoanaerobaculia bacterium]
MRARLRDLLRAAAARAAALGAAFLLAAAAMSAFEGRVTLAGSGKPAAGAEVSVLGTNRVERTDADGRFRWEPSPTPPFEVLVVLPGGRYMKSVLVAILPASGPVGIEVAPLAAESVAVTGSAPTIESPPVSASTIVPRGDLEVRQPENLAQALESVAGVSQVSEGQAAVPAVRGLARGRTLILVDGARVTSERRVGPSATYLDPFAFDAVEVSRGPGSVAYGSDAFGGVIAARTRDVAPGSPPALRATGSVGFGTPGGRGGVELSGGLGQNGGFLLLGHYRSFGDWDSPEGEVFNSGWRDSGVLLRADYRVGPGKLTAGWEGNWGRDIERPREDSSIVRFFYPEEDSSRFTLAWDAGLAGGFSRLGLSAFLGTYELVTDQDRFATPTEPRSVERADVSARDFEARAFAERFLGSTRLELGLHANGRFDLHALDVSLVYSDPNAPDESVNISIEDARRTDLGVYLAADAAPLPKLQVSAGARGDAVSTKNTGGYFGDRSTDKGAFSGFLAVTGGPFGGLSATAQIARGFRDPTLSDRYFRGPSGRGFVTGNPDLEPETSLQLDLALRYAGPWYRLALYGYRYRIDDLIERYEQTPDNFFFRNRGRARLQGVELEAQADLPEGFSLGIAAQLERGETQEDGAPPDDVPPESLVLQGRKTFGRGFAQLRVGAFARGTRPGPTERETPGYAIVDVGGGWNATPWLELQAYLRNLLDQKYLASPDPRGVLAPGISATFTALLRL